MSSYVSVVLVLCFILQSLTLCSASVRNVMPTSKDHLEAFPKAGKSPVTSYFRHNIYGPNSYAFGFEVNDKTSGNVQFRDEKRYSNGTIDGSYGYLRPDGSVSITHFKADAEMGYLSETQNFQPGEDAKWVDKWPTKKPNILMDKPLETVKPEVTFDEKEQLNLTSILLPVEPIKEEHGIDLNPHNLEKELVNPAVLEVINGEAPLIANNKQKDQGIGFATINKFIPSDFPIVPFELPQADNHNEKAEDKNNKKLDKENEAKPKSASNKYNEQKHNNSEKTITTPDLLPSPVDKYVKSKENNSEKSIPVETLRITAESSNTENNNKSSGKAKSLLTHGGDWYESIIHKARQEYLQ